MELDRLANGFIEKEKRLISEWSNLQENERVLLDAFVKKYGEGSLNMEDGVFIPTNQVSK